MCQNVPSAKHGAVIQLYTQPNVAYLFTRQQTLGCYEHGSQISPSLFSVLLGTHPDVELLDHVVCV